MIHICQYRVIYGDTDKAGVVYYGNYLRLFEIGRTEFLRKFVKTTYKEIESLGLVMPVVEVYVRYKAPAYYDDLLNIETAISSLDSFSVTFLYRIVRSGEDTLIAQGSTKLCVCRMADGGVTRMPEGLFNALNPLVLKSGSSTSTSGNRLVHAPSM